MTSQYQMFPHRAQPPQGTQGQMIMTVLSLSIVPNRMGHLIMTGQYQMSPIGPQPLQRCQGHLIMSRQYHMSLHRGPASPKVPGTFDNDRSVIINCPKWDGTFDNVRTISYVPP